MCTYKWGDIQQDHRNVDRRVCDSSRGVLLTETLQEDEVSDSMAHVVRS